MTSYKLDEITPGVLLAASRSLARHPLHSPALPTLTAGQPDEGDDA